MATATLQRETPQAALERIENGFSKNDAMAIMYFASCGIPLHDIHPRTDVLTFRAWKAKGRSVAKGATGCAITVWISKGSEKNEVTEGTPDASEKKKRPGCFPKTTRLFHVSQTIPADADKGTRPDCFGNAELMKMDDSKVREHYGIN